MTPYEVRLRSFTPRRLGVDAEEVRAFLHRLADQLTELQQELNAVHRENDRIKRALRDWQSAHTRHIPPRPRPAHGSRGRW